MSTASKHVGYAFRQLKNSPGLPFVIVLSLAFAMGISTSMFSVINRLWFVHWSVPNGHELRIVTPRVSEQEWQHVRRLVRSLSTVGGRRGTVLTRYERQVLLADLVSDNYFAVLRAPLVMGPGFQADTLGNHGVDEVIVAYRFWQTYLAGDKDVIGRSIVLQPTTTSARQLSLTVVGVASPGFDGTDSLRTALWLPMAIHEKLLPPATQANGSSQHPITLFGRMAPEFSTTRAEAELTWLLSHTRAAYTMSMAPVRLLGTERYVQAALPLQTRLLWAMLLAGMTFITLVACANVSNLLMARGAARSGEIAIRMALGSSRRRIVAQLLTESALLCAVAAILGLAIAWLLPAYLYSLIIDASDASTLQLQEFTFPIDGRVFLFGLFMSGVACLSFGLVPALRCSDLDVNSMLKRTHGTTGAALMPSLLSYQAIACVMAMTIAGLLLRSAPVAEARAMRSAMRDVSVVRLDGLDELEPARRLTVIEAAKARLSEASADRTVAGIVGQLQPGGSQTIRVTPEFFDVVHTRWRSGRPFAKFDAADQVMVINQAFAERYWGIDGGLGEILRSEDIGEASLRGRQVVGIVENTHSYRPTAYVPADWETVNGLLVRAPSSQVTPASLSTPEWSEHSLRAKVVSGNNWIAPAIGPTVIIAIVTMVFGVVALIFGTIGFFSFLQFSAQRRKIELGLRRALGAQSHHLAYALVQPAARPLLRGVVLARIIREGPNSVTSGYIVGPRVANRCAAEGATEAARR